LSEGTLEELQIKIAFLERASAELSDVVFRQDREIQRLASQLKNLSERLSGAQSDEGPRTPDQEIPPHY
jgi:uncharacterized coiled-coil protein SlyX